MSTQVEIRLPQLGEGLREARIVELLCVAGDFLTRGDRIYIIETDKSTVELESPLDGKLIEWRVVPGDVVPIDSTVAIASSDSSSASANVVPERFVPPRTRVYARERGVDAELLESIPAASNKLLPQDIDAYLSAGEPPTPGRLPFVDRKIVGAQRALIYRLRRSSELVIPGTIAGSLPWKYLMARVNDAQRPRPSPFQVLTHAVAKLAAVHPKFRSIMIGDDRVRQFDDVNVGIAMARPNDELIIALVRNAGSLSLSQYVRACAVQMRNAIRNGDQAADDMQILVSYLGEFGVHDAIPSLVAPASAVFFLGAPRSESGIARVVLTFDHRLINGAAAARFLSELLVALGTA
jgi:pyruvate dehydrogenase E2 component (dihydrolipoamide acetyltransferase)